MMPEYSWTVPGRKPGTSTKVTMGMLKQSQNRTNRAALRLEVDVEASGQHHRLIGNDADRAALDAAEAGDDVARPARAMGKKSPSSTTFSTNSIMS